MIDFSRCLKYKSKNNGTHIAYQQFSNKDELNPSASRSKLDDNAFTSVNHQIGIQSSRRDDIESLMFLILYMVKGKLPWYGQGGGSNSNSISGVINNEEKPDTSPNINLAPPEKKSVLGGRHNVGSLAQMPGTSTSL